MFNEDVSVFNTVPHDAVVSAVDLINVVPVDSHFIENVEPQQYQDNNDDDDDANTDSKKDMPAVYNIRNYC